MPTATSSSVSPTARPRPPPAATCHHSDLHNTVIRGDQDAVREIVSTVGLTEESFQAQGGGMWLWIALVGGFIAAHAMFTKPKCTTCARWVSPGQSLCQCTVSGYGLMAGPFPLARLE